MVITRPPGHGRRPSPARWSRAPGAASSIRTRPPSTASTAIRSSLRDETTSFLDGALLQREEEPYARAAPATAGGAFGFGQGLVKESGRPRPHVAAGTRRSARLRSDARPPDPHRSSCG